MKNVPDIFISPELQAEFDEKGFVKVPFLDEKQVSYLSDYFDQLHPSLPSEGFVSGSYSSDFAYKQKVSEEIKKVFRESNERYFKDFQAFGGSFLYKVPSENSDLVLHQDWSIVEEGKAVALNCWVPLCDTKVSNGTLMVLPGSHYNNYPVLRAPTLNFFFTGKEEMLMERLIPTNAKAGEAVILNQSLVHYSHSNKVR